MDLLYKIIINMSIKKIEIILLITFFKWGQIKRWEVRRSDMFHFIGTIGHFIIPNHFSRKKSETPNEDFRPADSFIVSAYGYNFKLLVPMNI